MKDLPLNTDERIDDLQLNGLKIIQNTNGFCFGIDAVLLSHFINAKKNDTLVEFGTGTGIIPILLAEKSDFNKIYTFEVQPTVADMARRSIALNGLEDKIEIIEDNLINSKLYLKSGTIDGIFSNPPYMTAEGGIKNPDDRKAISRHEILCSLEDIIANAEKLLKFGGSLYMIHRPNRLVDLISLCRAYRLEPKIIQMIQPYWNKSPNIMLVKCTKGGKPDLKFLDPIIVYESKGQFSKQIYDIYGMQNITSFTQD